MLAAKACNICIATAQNFFFMNGESFEQFEVTADLVGDGAGYLKEGDQVQLQFFDGRPISVELPKNVPLKVTYTEDCRQRRYQHLYH